ncbi:MAG: flavodoxin family protein [Bacillota bacterium]
MIRALCIMGSPRKKGNTELLMEKFAEGLETADVLFEKMVLSDMKISPCVACESCWNSLGCSIDDDMQRLYKKLDEADLVIIATPVYFGNVSSFVKIVMDRFQAVLAGKILAEEGTYASELINRNKKRYGFIIATAARDDYSRWSPIYDICKTMFNLLNAELLGEHLVPGTYNKLVTEMPGVLQEAYEKGTELAKKL